MNEVILSILDKLNPYYSTIDSVGRVVLNGRLTEELSEHDASVLADAILAGQKWFMTEESVFIIGEAVHLNGEENGIVVLYPIDSKLVRNVREMVEQILDRLNDGVMISDSDGKILAYNRAMEKLENMDRDEMVYQFLWDAYGYSGESLSEHRYVYRTGKSLENQYSAHTKVNGQPLYTIYSTYPILERGKTVGVITVSGSESSMHDRLVQATETKRKYNVNYDMNTGRTYSENGTSYSFADFIGESDSVEQLIKEAQTISWLDNNIMIVGETGTGKEVLAQSIHNHGKRSAEPFIGVNCGAIPENLLESILFGTVKGAFTGAVDHPGLFEEAGDGTLFLDEINSMPIQLQVKLLRVVQERRVSRLGDNKNYEVRCRFISAMNERPYDAINSGLFREDLYYRLGGFNLHIPPLRDRREDVIILVEYFARRYAKLMDKKVIGADDRLGKILTNYDWPGNIRELENLVENMLVSVSDDDRYLHAENIPRYLQKRIVGDHVNARETEYQGSLTEMTEAFEKEIVARALKENGFNISKTARELGIIRQNLLYRIKKYGIKKEA